MASSHALICLLHGEVFRRLGHLQGRYLPLQLLHLGPDIRRQAIRLWKSSSAHAFCPRTGSTTDFDDRTPLDPQIKDCPLVLREVAFPAEPVALWLNQITL